jgi:GT2 family glycosyltransferase
MRKEPCYEYEVIVVNGGNSVNIEHEVITKLITLPTNDGFTKTLNAGLRAVSDDADYVLFTSNDCFPITIPFFGNLVPTLDKGNVGVVSPVPDRPSIEQYKHLTLKEDNQYYYCNFFPTITWLFKKELLTRVGYLDEDYPGTGMYADNDWSQRVVNEYGELSILVVKDVHLHHKLSSESGQFNITMDMERGNSIFRKKWG